MEKKLLEWFVKKYYKRQIKKNLLKAQWKKMINYFWSRKAMTMFNSWIDEKIYYYIKLFIYQEPYNYSRNKTKVQLDLPNYET